MVLSERKLKILNAIIDEYILNGIPVGSRILAKRSGLGVSAATIRNEMADLEEYGFLQQAHTSAGRTPTHKAYRLYVDTLMNASFLNETEATHIKHYYNQRLSELKDIVAVTAKALSEMTNLTSIVSAPELALVQVRRIQIVKVTEDRALLIMVLNTGIIKDILVPVPRDMDDAYFDMISGFLSQRVRNMSLQDAIDIVSSSINSELDSHKIFLNNIFDAVQQESQKTLILDGAQYIFDQPEFKDLQKAKNFLQLLDQKDTLYSILKNTSEMEFTIKIGNENEIDSLKDMSVITATYTVQGKSIGSFGVIGPTRMNYSKVCSVLSAVGANLNDILTCFLEDT